MSKKKYFSFLVMILTWGTILFLVSGCDFFNNLFGGSSFWLRTRLGRLVVKEIEKGTKTQAGINTSKARSGLIP